MNRRTLLILATCGLGGLLIVLVWFLVRGRLPEPVVLSDTDVESVTAEVFPVDVMGTDHIPPFAIPQEYHSQVLDALRPIMTTYPPAGGELPAVAKLSIRKRDGTNVEVLVPLGGQNRLCYKLNGAWCVRDGLYEPVDTIILDDGSKMGYADETLMLSGALRHIHHELTTGQEDSGWEDAFEDLERSAGKRPPRP